jgi:hypothetical protein
MTTLAPHLWLNWIVLTAFPDFMGVGIEGIEELPAVATGEEYTKGEQQTVLSRSILSQGTPLYLRSVSFPRLAVLQTNR